MNFKNEIVWIDCKEKMPEICDDYLVLIKQKYDYEKEWEYHVDVAENYGNYIDDYWDTYNDWIEGQETHVTHWAVIPFPYYLVEKTNKINEEKIKEIRDKIKCPQFGSFEYGEWGILNFEQRLTIKKMCDYIEDLQTRWNSLRNYIKNELESCERLEVSSLSIMELKLLLDKMNELEGDNK